MREEEEANWFARWEEQLPSPEELMPLSQTLITPDLALAFDIPTIRSNPNPNPSLHHHHTAPSLHPPPPVPSSQPPPDFDSPDHLTTASSGGGACGGGGGSGEEPARTLKRPRLVWTPQLHKRFVDAVAHLGIKNAVPKTIMQLMGVEGLTRENVASHLQKYRLYLKRMQQSSSSSSSAALAGGHISAADHQLFASGPLPHHFLSPRGAAGPEPPFVPLVAVNALHHHHHHHQIGQQYYYQRQMGHFGSAASGGVGGGGGFDYRFLSPPPIGMQHVGMGMGMGMGMGFPPVASSYGEQLESGERGGGRRELTLFPTGDD